MSELMIKCPHCKKEFPFTATLAAQDIREEVRGEFEEKERAKEEEFARRESALQAEAERNKKEKKAIEEQVKRQVEQGLEAAKKQLEQQATQKAREDSALELQNARNEAVENKNKRKEAEKRELESLKKQREMEEQGKKLELEMERKLADEREGIEAQARTRTQEEYKLREMEKEKKISDLNKQVDDMKRKLEQGSQQLQGEVLELELETTLKAEFPMDRIEPVPKGVKGADVLQKVYNDVGQQCGTIIWESKRTSNWSDGWIAKLKEDQLAAKADIAALLSLALPKDFSNLGEINGVWVANLASLVGLAAVLRAGLVRVAGARTALDGKQSKMEQMYHYLYSPQFRQRVEATVDHFLQMKQDLDKEKTYMLKAWTKREKQLELVNINTVGMIGDMEAIMGGTLPTLNTLEIKQLGPGQRSDEDRHPEPQEQEQFPSPGLAASQAKTDEQGECLDPPQSFRAGGLVFQYDGDSEGVWHDSKDRGVCLMNSKDARAKSVGPKIWQGCYVQLDDFLKDPYLFSRIVSDLEAIPYFSSASTVRAPNPLGDE